MKVEYIVRWTCLVGHKYLAQSGFYTNDQEREKVFESQLDAEKWATSVFDIGDNVKKVEVVKREYKETKILDREYRKPILQCGWCGVISRKGKSWAPYGDDWVCGPCQLYA